LPLYSGHLFLDAGYSFPFTDLIKGDGALLI
jgi:hypothetical protein